MIKSWFFGVILLINGLVCAKSTCNDIYGQQSYPPLSIKNGMVCFVLEPVLDPKTGVPIGADAIYLYYIDNENPAMKTEGQGLLYDDTPGEIVDAFSSISDQDHHEKIFVIHSIRIRWSLVEPNSSGKFYSVSVFDLFGNILHGDKRASEWFGADYSWLSDGRKIIYRFPYKSRSDVRQAMSSPFAMLMSADALIPVRLKNKSYLFENPNAKSATRKYLIEGDRVTVNKVTAGWCQVNYSGGAKPLDMWLMCSALHAEAYAGNKD